MANIIETQFVEHSPDGIQRMVVVERRPKITSLWQFARFGVVGVLNTCVDIAALNLFLWRFPTSDPNLLLIYNSLAYLLGALNSFILNKYWTFQSKRKASQREVLRFLGVNIAGVLCNDCLIWLIGKGLQPFITDTFLWGNMSKVSAILGTMFLSYLGMRLWVFASASKTADTGQTLPLPLVSRQAEKGTFKQHGSPSNEKRQAFAERDGEDYLTSFSLSVILPAHNEEAIIAQTIKHSMQILTRWVQDFEIIVVNDGSKDHTKMIVEELALAHPCVRVLNHPVNQGYGAALVSGFKAVTKDLAFFMDSDGQFDIRDLDLFFPLIEQYDAVLGYRFDRQDSQLRKINAWGWKMLIRAVLRLHVRDIDCAFKLFRADFFLEQQLETRGAMINTEILYKWTRAGHTYTQVGVHHLPRRGGRATGAKPAVILRAFRELAVYAWKWRYGGRRLVRKARDEHSDK